MKRSRTTEQKIIAKVHKIRRDQPRVGGRKILLDIQSDGIEIGRDRLFRILRKYNLLVEKKRNYTRTTDSNHRFRKYANLVKGAYLTGPNQVIVSDITYLRINNEFAYLSLVTDAWSRKILGWDISTSLGVSGAIRALKMALNNIPHPEGLIHHSDRGIQYCCKDYIQLLNDHNVLISMTEENHCYENAIAERINRTLKDEFLLNQTLSSFDFAKELTRDSINAYNYKRRHMSLDYQIPADVHEMFSIKNCQPFSGR